MESPQLNRLEKANDALVGSTATLVRECNSFLHVAAPDYRSSGITPASRHALLVRHDKGLDVYSVLPCSENSDPLVVFNVPGQVLNATWCPNGKFLAVHSANEGICLYRVRFMLQLLFFSLYATLCRYSTQRGIPQMSLLNELF